MNETTSPPDLGGTTKDYFPFDQAVRGELVCALNLPIFNMFGTVRKHQSWLWAIIIVIIIVSFVFFFSPNANLDMIGAETNNFGTIQGKPISREEMTKAYTDVRILYRLRFQQWPGNDDFARLEPEIYNRLLLSKKIEQLNIDVSPEATVTWIKNLFQRGGAPGTSVSDQYQQFVNTQLIPNGVTAADFERFARNQVGEEHLRSVFGMSGSMIPRTEAETLYKRENESMQADAVFFSATNFLNQVKVDDEALTRYFNLNKPNYRIPDRIQVAYVHFNPSNFVSAAQQQFASDTNVNLVLERAYFERGGTNSFKDKDGNPLNLEQAKPQLKEEYLKRLALVEARKRAAEFINAVDEYQQKNPTAQDALAKVATAQNLKVQESPLIDQGTDLSKLNLPFAFRNAAFALTEENRFSTSPVLSEQGVFALSLVKKVPGVIPELAQVKEKVTQDFKQSEAVKLARNAGEAFQKALTAGLAEKKSIESILIAHKAKSVALPPFTMTTQSMPELAGRLELDRLQNAASRLSPGSSTDLLATDNGGAVIYLRDRKEVDAQKLNAEIADYTDRLREQREYMAFMNWLQGLATEMELRRPVQEPAQAQAKT